MECTRYDNTYDIVLILLVTCIIYNGKKKKILVVGVAVVAQEGNTVAAPALNSQSVPSNSGMHYCYNMRMRPYQPHPHSCMQSPNTRAYFPSD